MVMGCDGCDGQCADCNAKSKKFWEAKRLLYQCLQILPEGSLKERIRYEIRDDLAYLKKTTKP